jgi:hypothetical protein
MFKSLPAGEQENFLDGLIQEHAYQRGIEGLPLVGGKVFPKEQEASTSDRATHADGKAHRMERVLKKVAEHLQGELDRGYVLTDEPLAGTLWRRRHNDLLGEVEQVIGR